MPPGLVGTAGIASLWETRVRLPLCDGHTAGVEQTNSHDRGIMHAEVGSDLPCGHARSGS